MSRDSRCDLAAALEFAVSAARRAGAVTMEYFGTGVAVEIKGDASPVTVADRRAEQELRELLRARFPDDTVLGEEYGETPGTSGRRWILDPIDGTKSYIAGVPLWGVMIGLEDRGKPAAGVVYVPALNEMVYAARGLGCHWLPSGHKPDDKPRPARVSSVARLGDGLVTAAAISSFEKSGKVPAYERIRKAAKVDRGWSDCYGHLLVATGRAEVMLDPVMSIWDCAALLPILLEAGGTFTDWKGDFTISGGDAFSTNGKVFEETLRLIQK